MTPRYRPASALALVLLVLLTAAACGSGRDVIEAHRDGRVAAAAAAERTPSEDFRAALANVTGATSDQWLTQAEQAAQSACDAMTAAGQAVAGNPGADPTADDLMDAMVLAQLFELGGEHSGMVLRVTAEHLCPEHGASITAFADARGVPAWPA